MMDLRELYQEIILDHNRSPRNFRCIEGICRSAKGFNPLCGDKVTVYLKIEKDRIVDLSFLGKGCAISQASASLMTEALLGKTVVEAEKIFESFHKLVTTEDPISFDEKWTVLRGVQAFPARVKCATLAWHTFEAALHNDDRPVKTE